MEKEVKLIYSILDTIFCLFFISLGWITFIIVMIISVKQGFQSKDWIGITIALVIYISIDLMFFLGVLKYTLTRIKLNSRGITVKEPFKKERYVEWTLVESISEGFVPSYLFGPTKGYTIKISSDNSEKGIYLIKSKKITVFLDKIKRKNENS